eukprot:7427623-Karenia_brevis.AAC.1
MRVEGMARKGVVRPSIDFSESAQFAIWNVHNYDISDEQFAEFARELKKDLKKGPKRSTTLHRCCSRRH